jgi:endonuclease III
MPKTNAKPPAKTPVKKAPKAPAKLLERALAVHERLSEAQPEPICELDHRNAFELLVATILSAQSTDKGVNRVTPELFRRWPTPAALCALFPRDAWIDTGHRLVLHGRYLCTARSPKCARCPLNELCPSAEAPPENPWPERAERERAFIASRGESD